MTLSAGTSNGALALAGSWTTAFDPENRARLEAVLPNFLRNQRWFASKARTIGSVTIRDTARLPHSGAPSYYVFAQVEYTEGYGELYALPVSFAAGKQAEHVARHFSHALLVRLRCAEGPGVLYDALRDEGFAAGLLEGIERRLPLETGAGKLLCTPTSVLYRLRGDPALPLAPTLLGAEQSNSSLRFGDRLILKLFRRLEPGLNPDLDIGAFLTEETSFRQSPPLAGHVEYQAGSGEPMTLGMLQGYVANQGDAWKYTLDHLSGYYAQVAGLSLEILQTEPSTEKLPGFAHPEIPAELAEVMGGYLDSIRLLGRRTAELHLALASAPEGHGFAPEPFTTPYRQSLFESMRNLTLQTLQLLRGKIADLPVALRPSAQNVADREGELLRTFHAVLDDNITAVRTRVHGDYHLGQVLYTGSDFVIIDFEGEPARSIAERRTKRSPLLDVAGMLRSFHYAAYAALLGSAGGQFPRQEHLSALEPWATFWHQCASGAFLSSYLEVAAGAPFLPKDRGQFTGLLSAFLFEKGIYEIRYELNNRPGWLRIPLEGISQLLRAAR